MAALSTWWAARHRSRQWTRAATLQGAVAVCLMMLCYQPSTITSLHAVITYTRQNQTHRSESRLALCGMQQDHPLGWGLCAPASLQTACVRHLSLEIAANRCSLADLQATGLPDVLLRDIQAAAHPSSAARDCPATKTPVALSNEGPAAAFPALYVCTACKAVHAEMDATTNPAHHRYLELARRRHYAPARRGGRGAGINVVGTVRAAVGLTAAFAVGRMMRTVSERRDRGA